jgi:cytoskeletal protein CcmA (bactofilin family)
MFKQKDNNLIENLDTLIGVNTVFEGNIESQGTVKIDGKVKGDLKISGDLIIGNNATVIGNIFANNVNLSGTIEGNIHSTGVLKILTTARLYGDIEVHSFVADEGGIFQGKCSMLDVNKNEHNSEKINFKKVHTNKDFKKSSVLDQLYDEKEKTNGVSDD